MTYKLYLQGSEVLESSAVAEIAAFLNQPELFGWNKEAISLEKIVVTDDGTPLTVVKKPDSLRVQAFGVQQSGDAKSVATRLIDEVEYCFMRKPTGEIRKPWEMLPHQWKSFTIIGSAIYGIAPMFSAEQLQEVFPFEDSQGNVRTGWIADYLHSEIFRRFNHGHNGPAYGPGRNENSRHEVHVSYALAQGLPVPEEVMGWYRENWKIVEGSFDVKKWFEVLLRYPEYRGALLNAGMLVDFIQLCLNEKILLTGENAPYLLSLMREMPSSASRTDIDDHLYMKGVLKKREAKIQGAIPDASEAYNDFASRLRERLAQSRLKASIARADEGREKYHWPIRDYEFEIDIANLAMAYESFKYPNRFAKAIEAKDIQELLIFLDAPEGDNVTTKRLVHDVYGLKTFGVPAADRRRAIFEFCGYDDAKRIQYEQELEKARADKVAQGELEKAKNRASQVSYRVDGEIMTGAEYVDKRVAAGYDEILTRKRGNAVTYWISNRNGYLSALRKNDGTLDYAMLVHGLQIKNQAA